MWRNICLVRLIHETPERALEPSRYLFRPASVAFHRLDHFKALPQHLDFPQKSGSSRFTGKRGFDLQKEVSVIPVTVGHSLDDLDPVVHAF